MGKQFRLTTESGYDLGEVASALQKCIRRGRTEESLFWAFELDSKLPNFLWKRLVTIVNEDVGLADPPTIVLIDALRRHYEILIESRDRRMVVTNAILALCNATKTQLASDMTTTIFRRKFYEGWKLEIPDYGFDHHTARGAAKARGLDHWIQEGAFLVKEAKGMNPYRDEANRLRMKFGPGKEQPKPVVPSKKRKKTPDGELF